MKETSKQIQSTIFKVFSKGIVFQYCCSFFSVNPLSFLLKKLKGYQFGPSGKHDTPTNRLFFTDDLKLIAVTLDFLKQQLDLVTQFSSNIE